MTREEFDNIKEGDLLWHVKDGFAPVLYTVDETGRIGNSVTAVYIWGRWYTYEEACDHFQVEEPEPKEDNPKGLDLPNSTAADLLGTNVPKEGLVFAFFAKDVLNKDKYTIGKNGLITNKTKTMKKKKVAKGHVYNPNPSKVDKRICLLCFYGLTQVLEGVFLYSIAKWDRLDIILQLGLAEDEAGLRKAAKVAGVKYKKAKKYLAQF